MAERRWVLRMAFVVCGGLLCASAGRVHAAGRSQAPAPPASEGQPLRLVMMLKGRGVQIYNCRRRPGQTAA